MHNDLDDECKTILEMINPLIRNKTSILSHLIKISNEKMIYTSLLVIKIKTKESPKNNFTCALVGCKY